MPRPRIVDRTGTAGRHDCDRRSRTPAGRAAVLAARRSAFEHAAADRPCPARGSRRGLAPRARAADPRMTTPMRRRGRLLRPRRHESGFPASDAMGRGCRTPPAAAHVGKVEANGASTEGAAASPPKWSLANGSIRTACPATNARTRRERSRPTSSVFLPVQPSCKGIRQIPDGPQTKGRGSLRGLRFGSVRRRLTSSSSPRASCRDPPAT